MEDGRGYCNAAAPNPATVPSGSGMPDITNLVHETLYEDKMAPLPADWIPPFSADPESGGLWAVTGTAFDPPVYMTDDSEKAFCIADALNAVHSPTGKLATLRTQLAASQEECERLRHDLITLQSNWSNRNSSLQAERDEAVLLLQAFAGADDWELKPAIDAESFLARIQAEKQ